MRRGSGLGLLLQKHEFGGVDTKFRSVYSMPVVYVSAKALTWPLNLERFCYFWGNHTPALRHRQSDKIDHPGSQTQPLRPGNLQIGRQRHFLEFVGLIKFLFLEGGSRIDAVSLYLVPAMLKFLSIQPDECSRRERREPNQQIRPG